MVNNEKYEDYLNFTSTKNLHPSLTKIYKKFPNDIKDLNNLIFYGPPGVGKYTQFLTSIKKYSPSNLLYEKKICVTHAKQNYYIKISDIHFEVDMSLLGCNAKILWSEIYTQITDIVMSSKNKCGIILCKHFQDVNSELLEIFYSYMQSRSNNFVHISFIFLTTQISFFPDSILDCCKTLKISRPTRSQYNKCLRTNLDKETPLHNIVNIKNLKNNITQLTNSHYNICNKLINIILNINENSFIDVRESIYDIFIYNLDIGDCIWYIVKSLIDKNHFCIKKTDKLFSHTTTFLQYFNNNYRPIYHLESFIFYLINSVHEFE